jgi:SAM-dependent methyltransferase
MTLKYRQAKLLASTLPVTLPIVGPDYRKILDLGCGAEGTLLALGLPIDAVLVALDLNLDPLKVLRQRTVNLQLVCGSGELLPFKDQCFDFVLSKVALPYMNIPVAVREVNRVLRDGGQVWVTLHPFRMAAERILRDLKRFNLQDALYQFYAVVNGFALELLGRQFRFPANRGRCESIQTMRGIAKALFAAGFCDVQFEIRDRGDAPGPNAKPVKLFVVSARKRFGRHGLG